jgi:hypothetical protein
MYKAPMLSVRSTQGELIEHSSNSLAAWMIGSAFCDSIVDIELSVELIAKRRITNVQLECDVFAFADKSELQKRRRDGLDDSLEISCKPYS